MKIFNHLRGRALPYWLKVKIVEDVGHINGEEVGIYRVSFHSLIHKPKEYVISWSYCREDFTPHSILNDRALYTRCVKLYDPYQTR